MERLQHSTLKFIRTTTCRYHFHVREIAYTQSRNNHTNLISLTKLILGAPELLKTFKKNLQVYQNVCVCG